MSSPMLLVLLQGLPGGTGAKIPRFLMQGGTGSIPSWGIQDPTRHTPWTKPLFIN